jgi:2-oxoglutarate dehydrogenase E1 component
MQHDQMELLWNSSHVFGGNAAYVEDLYEQYLLDPNSVSGQWRDYFDKLPRVSGYSARDIPHSQVIEQFAQLGKRRSGDARSEESISTAYERKQVHVVEMIDAFRQRGHQQASLDPLSLIQREVVPDLKLHFYGLSAADLDTIFQTSTLNMGQDEATLGSIVEALQKTYCATVGAEFTHIVATDERQWIQSRMEAVRSAPEWSDDIKIHLLERLTAAEGLEKFLGSKYPGTKRFGLEGGESLIPMLDEIVQRAGSYEVREMVIGMAHRGRLNVLVNILGKNPADLFDEFEGKATYEGSSDVKYHQGFSSNVMTPGGDIHLALAFNPSHLEIVSPVVEGSVRARQDLRGDGPREQVIPLVIHGDAAFAGQGVVMETFQMSQTRAYGTGGTVHIVINNQVGFTTNRQDDVRSTEYCTDIAKMVQAPIFHVNGDDPEAVLFVTQMALDFRQEFKKDVVIDLMCYRRRGHNEADEPSGTQPLMYSQIRKQRTTRDLYADRLVEEGTIDQQQDKQLIADYRACLADGQHVANSLVMEGPRALLELWLPHINHNWESDAVADTRVDLRALQELMQRVNEAPEGFAVQAQVAKIIEDRRKMAVGAMAINWGFAEIAAYASLLDEGYAVRLVGQDAGRGTFSHRHAVLHNQRDAETYVPLQHVVPDGPQFNIHDSFLSEEAALAFEYGYATTTPDTLVIWEAQFGDFANGAQVVIDQFIASGELKWQRLCGLTMLLPHGYEGQGPEHSSARLERFMQLSAENNIQVCIPTTPAQIFHLLRRQMVRPLRKPLIIMSPKSLLRHRQAVSQLEELAEGEFRTVIGESEELDAAGVKRLVLCAGKVYYDLLDLRRQHEIDDVAIVRMEQMYPFPSKALRQEMEPFCNLTSAVWCQEEPQNQGCWYSSQHHMKRTISDLYPDVYLEYAGRKASAAPAAGYLALHMAQQKQLLDDALGIQSVD